MTKFMSKPLRDAGTRYTLIEKHAYALVKSLKYFRIYMGYNKIHAYVLYPTVKYVLMQSDVKYMLTQSDFLG